MALPFNHTSALSRRTWLRHSAITLAALACSSRKTSVLFAQSARLQGPVQSPLTDAQEIALGRRFAAAFETESPILSSPLIDQHLNQLVRELAVYSRRPTLPYRAKVINLPSLNAASLPGGAIYVHRGLLELVATEDELVAVLSHEIGHIAARHAIHQLAFTLQAQALLRPLLDNLARQNGAVEGIIEQLGGAVALMTRLTFTRHDELEADNLGFYDTLRSGWDPRGFLKLFAALQEKETTQDPGKDPGANSIAQPVFPAHPPTAERASAIQRLLSSVTIPEDARTDSLDFRACKQALTLLGQHPVSPPG